MKTTLALLVLFFIVLGGGYVLSYPSIATTSPPLTQTQPTASQGKSGAYTRSQVAAHNTSGRCWASISGSVYDLTTWIVQHPGGEGAILSICGKDGTQAFEGQHGGSRGGHAQSILASYKIGTLAS